jgi:hypothetical protein
MAVLNKKRAGIFLEVRNFIGRKNNLITSKTCLHTKQHKEKWLGKGKF